MYARRIPVLPLRPISTIVFLFLCVAAAQAQDSSGEGTLLRGDRAEIAVTIRDNSGEPISSEAMVKLYRAGGIPTDQKTASKGRAFFILPSLGDYTIVVDAPGYKTAQKDISVPVALKAEIEISLARASASGDAPVSIKPLLAPKAKEAFDRGLQALSENKVDEATRYVGEAAKLAPGHPDVLYLQGVLFLKKQDWPQAQSVLEKATQLDPNHAQAFAALGMALSDQGKYQAATAPLEKSLQLGANSWETQWILAKAYYHNGQYEPALHMAQEALAGSNGKAPEISLLVAQSLTAVGRYEDAAQVLRDFLKAHPDQPQATTARRWLGKLTADGKVRPQ